MYRNFLAYADGKNDLIDIANIIGISADKLIDIAKLFEQYNLIERKNHV
ncbi:MAG: winged helix-turn-helix domain-containing protein [Nautiliaceae bacterium]